MQIAEFSEKLGLSPDTIRYYEKIGLIPPVKRTKGGIRDFSEEDLKRGDFVKCMRAAGLPIEALSRYFDLIEQGDETVNLRIELLQEQRDKLVEHMKELEDTLTKLNKKIGFYDEKLYKKEKQLVGEER